jgi:hypothetical protein
MSDSPASESIEGGYSHRYPTLDDAFAAFRHESAVFREIYDAFAQSVGQTKELINHREHIEENSLGFGDRAFHWLWKLLVDAMPQAFRFLEIGVYKGQVLSLVGMLSARQNKRASIFGVTPLSPKGDKFSKYETIEYAEVIDALQDWSGIPIARRARLIEGFSTDDIVKRQCRGVAPYDIVYIDGGHDYHVVANDIITYGEMIVDGGYLVMDDASSELNMPNGIWAGHPDVGRAVRELLEPDQRFVERLAIGHLRIWQRFGEPTD